MQSTANRLVAVSAGAFASFAAGAALAHVQILPALARAVETFRDGTTFVLACVGPHGLLDTDPRLVLGQSGRAAHQDGESVGCLAR